MRTLLVLNGSLGAGLLCVFGAYVRALAAAVRAAGRDARLEDDGDLADAA